MTVVEAGGATKRFGTVTAVDGVSMQVAAGEVVGLLGANGAGKTTLMRMILGTLVPDAGHVRVLGSKPFRAIRARVGYVPQSLGLWPDLSVRDHLLLTEAVYGAAAKLDQDLQHVADRPVGHLPFGLRRRLAFSLAVAHRPDVVVLDEPTSGVDPLGRARLWDRIRAVAEAGAAVLVSTHYMDEAAQCDRCVLLAAGRLAATGTVNQLTTGRSAVTVRTDDWHHAWRVLDADDIPALPAGRHLRVTGVDAGRVTAVLTRAGIAADVSQVEAILEDVFLLASDAV